MDSEYSYGQMDLNTRDSGETIKLTAKGNYSMLTAISMREIGLMIKQKEEEHTVMQTGPTMKVPGTTINSMDTA